VRPTTVEPAAYTALGPSADRGSPGTDRGRGQNAEDLPCSHCAPWGSGLGRDGRDTGGAIVDPVTGGEARDQIVIVEDGVIHAAGRGLPIPVGARVVDLSTEWLVRNLIDARTHLMLAQFGGDAPGEAVYLAESTAQRSLHGLHNAQEVLAAGFATVRDVGFDAEYATLDVRRAIERGFFDGPPIVSPGRIITPLGGESSGIPPEAGRSGSTSTSIRTRSTTCAGQCAVIFTTTPASSS
jgi:hypothetical protein